MNLLTNLRTNTPRAIGFGLDGTPTSKRKLYARVWNSCRLEVRSHLFLVFEITQWTAVQRAQPSRSWVRNWSRSCSPLVLQTTSASARACSYPDICSSDPVHVLMPFRSSRCVHSVISGSSCRSASHSACHSQSASRCCSAQEVIRRAFIPLLAVPLILFAFCVFELGLQL